ncbi:Putative thiol oxidoreductase with 2 cytochrome c heme-binding site [Minicystis rosea]|nr:Putative thiol oxidoreductase with 2 cytochrome c heme-binding site [Minicystis rosea]
MMVSRRFLSPLIAVLLVGALASGGAPPVPWPRGVPPSSEVIDTLVAEAAELDAREQAEEWLDSAEAGEASEHLPIDQNDIDKGLYTKEDLFRLGDGFFSHPFTVNPDGYGDGHFVAFRRVHTGVRGGLDTFSCAGCHSVGGPDGAGSHTQNALLEGDGDRQTSAIERNAPALQGGGIVQGLGAEMSHELQYERDQARALAEQHQKPAETPLTTHGISFGSIVVYPDGHADTSKVVGVDADLVVKPFGWKGTTSRLRRFVEDAARIHFGIQSHVLCLQAKDHPDPAHLGSGTNWVDPDDDGHVRELEEGMLTAAAAYLAMLETPAIIPPADEGLRDRWASGSSLFRTIGCADCHARLVLLNTSWREASDTTSGEVVLSLFVDGEQPRGTNQVDLFSDLKRHAMGPALADPHDNTQGIPRDVFLTRPLWGLAETAPYLHDGRAATIPEAILAHGGEAQKSRDAFAALSAEDQASVHVFLLSLTREPRLRVAR